MISPTFRERISINVASFQVNRVCALTLEGENKDSLIAIVHEFAALNVKKRLSAVDIKLRCAKLRRQSTNIIRTIYGHHKHSSCRKVTRPERMVLKIFFVRFSGFVNGPSRVSSSSATLA